MLSNSNKGMFLEEIINNTIMWLDKNEKALFFKRNLPIKIYKKINNNINGKLYEKSQTDYYGVYKGFYIDFEAKQTNDDFFKYSNLKNHQYEHLLKVKKYLGISFIIIYFNRKEDFFSVDFEKIKLIDKKISYEWCLQNAFKFKLSLPGVINLTNYLDTKII